MENHNIEEDFIVYDNVFTREDSINIIRLFNKFKKSPVRGAHSYYNRNDRELGNPFEYMIEEYLQRIGDTSCMVEYWFRGLWVDVSCHQDLNEFLLKDKLIVINPLHGHIMYLSQDTYEAATILFNSAVNKVTAIYPKIGRFVRFNGNVFHYVPNPFSYIFGDDSTSKYNKPRFVLLFNTWKEYIPDPTETVLRCKTLSKPIFKPFSEWRKLNVFETVPLGDSDFKFRVKYMGDSKRRFGTDKIESFYVNRRFKEDGHSLQLIMYECHKIKKEESQIEERILEDLGYQN